MHHADSESDLHNRMDDGAKGWEQGPGWRPGRGRLPAGAHPPAEPVAPVSVYVNNINHSFYGLILLLQPLKV